MNSFFSYYITYNAASKYYYYSRGIYLYSFTYSSPPNKVIYPTYKMRKEYNFEDNYGGNF